MTTPLPDETPGEMTAASSSREAAHDDGWQGFEQGLATYLSAVFALDHLLIRVAEESPQTEGCAPYAQFDLGDDESVIRAELVSNHYLAQAWRVDEDQAALLIERGWRLGEPDEIDDSHNWVRDTAIDDAAALAHEVVVAFRQVFGVAHPQLLNYQAWGPAACLGDLLGIPDVEEVPVEPSHQAQGSIRDHVVYLPDDRNELVRLTGRLLQERLGSAPDVDADGDFVLHHLGQVVWVRVRHDQPAVEILARVAHRVRSQRAGFLEVGLLNRDHPWVSWVMHDQCIWQQLIVPAAPFVPAHLEGLLDVFFTAMSDTRDDLVLRLDAKVG